MTCIIRSGEDIEIKIVTGEGWVLFSHTIQYVEYNSINSFVHFVYNDDNSITKIEVNKISKQIIITHNEQEYRIILIDEDDVVEET